MSNPKVLVAPSILAADFGRLAEEARKVEEAGADWIHLDVMDGHFVDNLTFGPQVVAGLKPVTKLPLDVHLMIERPENFLEAFIRAGADLVTIHAEATEDLPGTIQKIRKLGAKAGMALCPANGLEPLKPVLGDLDLVLLMTVNPGFGGQAFMPEVLPKIEALRKIYDRHIEVDGGINQQTAAQTRSAGANVMVAGTYLFEAPDVRGAIASLRESSA